MRFTARGLMFLVAVEAVLARLVLGMYQCVGFGEFVGYWWTLHLFCVWPGVIWYLRSRSRDRVV